MIFHERIQLFTGIVIALHYALRERMSLLEGGSMTTTVIGVFSDFTAAINASPDLASAGFAREDISIVAQDSKGEYAKFVNAQTLPEPETGVETGAAIGGVGGFLLGLAAFAIPGIGPVIAAGPLVMAFAGATLGAVGGSLVGALNGLGVPEFEAKAYDQGVREGSTLVIVHPPAHLVTQAADIMRQHHAVRVDVHHGQENTATDVRA